MALIGEWKLNEAGGTAKADISGNNNTLTEVGGNVNQTTGHGGGANLANLFSGANYLNNTSVTPTLVNGKVSGCIWIKLPDVTTTQDLITQWASGAKSFVVLVSAGKVSFYVSTTGANSFVVTNTTTLSVNTWYCIGFNYDQVDMRIYLNGALDCTPVAQTAAIYNPAALPLYIGASNAGAGKVVANAVLDDLQIWNSASTATDFSNWYALGDDFAAASSSSSSSSSSFSSSSSSSASISSSSSSSSFSSSSSSSASISSSSSSSSLSSSSSSSSISTSVSSSSSSSSGSFSSSSSSSSASTSSSSSSSSSSASTSSSSSSSSGSFSSSSSSSSFSSSSSSSNSVPLVNGVVRDRLGTAIDCSLYNVRINVYPTNNTVTAPIVSVLCTNAGGIWQAQSASLVNGTKYLVSFDYVGTYTPLNDVDIAGADVMTAHL